MKFINKGNDVQVRISEGPNRYRWVGVRTGEEVDLPEMVGVANGFKRVTDSNLKLPKVTEGQIGKTKVETKQIDKITDNYTLDDLFFKELTKIKGIGKKTAKDIVIWGTKEKLIEQINLNAELPFRDDICILLQNKLRGKYDK